MCSRDGGGENPINFNLIEPSVRSVFQQTRFLHFGTRQNRMQLISAPTKTNQLDKPSINRPVLQTALSSGSTKRRF